MEVGSWKLKMISKLILKLKLKLKLKLILKLILLVQDLDRVNRTLSHELVHMYDYCTAHIDFSQIEHLACTEGRKL